MSRCPPPQAAGVYLLAAEHARGKVARFVDAVLASGAAWPVNDPAQVSAPQPLRTHASESAAAAAAVHAALHARRARLDAT